MHAEAVQSKILTTIGVAILSGLSVVGILVITYILVRATPTQTITSTRVSFMGETVCLPHRDTSGPQTLECAIGLRTSDNIYYGITQANPPMNIGQSVRINGQLQNDSIRKYNIAGTIEVQSWQQLTQQ